MEIREQCVYVGPNRRAPDTVIEQLLQFEPLEVDAFTDGWQTLLRQLDDSLTAMGLEGRGSSPEIADEDPVSRFCRLYSELAVYLQRMTGHRVRFVSLVPATGNLSCRAIFEFEEREVGLLAGTLARRILQRACPALVLSEETDQTHAPLAEQWQAFARASTQRTLPLDAEAIIAAAARAGIPVQKLDRAPFQSRPGDFRVRSGGGLRLGQCCHQHMVDGTFCVSRANPEEALERDRGAALRLLRQLGLPRPEDNLELGSSSGPARARRTARRIGYPMLCLDHERQSSIPAIPVDNEQQLMEAIARFESGGSPLLQQRPAGALHLALVGNGRLLCILQAGAEVATTRDVSGQCPGELRSQIEQAAGAIEAGLVCFSLVSENIGDAPVSFVDINVAPRLDSFLAPESEHMAAAADALVAWIFPPGTPCRVPIVAVTGTNGKTTTTNMMHWLLRHDGRRPGMAISDGMYDTERQMLASGDQSGIYAHSIMLSDPRFDCLALETAHGGMASSGFAFDSCDVAICLNVTRDHLVQFGIESVEDMAAVKRELPERARQGVVINVDNPQTRAMLPFPEAERTCLVSLSLTVAELESIPDSGDMFAVLEGQTENAELVLYDAGQRMPLLPAKDMPVSMGGIVHYNIANALHAAAAAYLMGVDTDTLVRGLSSFQAGDGLNPGRFNVYEHLPYKVIIDYAHNPDGLTQLASVVDRMEVSGQKVITVSAAAYQDEQTIWENALAVAGHFDHYYCFNYVRDFEAGRVAIAPQIAQALREAGVPVSQITEVDTDVVGTREAMARAREGDLLVLLTGRLSRDIVYGLVTGASDKRA